VGGDTDVFDFQDHCGVWKENGEKKRDPLKLLTDQDMSLEDMTRVVVTGLFSGQINSGINAALLVCYLGDTPECQEIIRKEVYGVVEGHRRSEIRKRPMFWRRSALKSGRRCFLWMIWGLKETLRMTMTGCGFRQNNSGTLRLGILGKLFWIMHLRYA
jgi:sterol 14-demethylase